jgi:hypothetical protein
MFDILDHLFQLFLLFIAENISKEFKEFLKNF